MVLHLQKVIHIVEEEGLPNLGQIPVHSDVKRTLNCGSESNLMTLNKLTALLCAMAHDHLLRFGEKGQVHKHTKLLSNGAASHFFRKCSRFYIPSFAPKIK